MMTETQITGRFLSLWKQKKLAHFYLFTHASLPLLKELTLNLIAQIILEHKKLSSLEIAKKMILEKSHPDIFWVEADLSTTLSELFRLNSYAASELGHRFIVLMGGPELSDHLSNKLLKFLEEPNANTTIILLKDPQYQLLPTLLSRALQWRWPQTESLAASPIPNLNTVREQLLQLSGDEEKIKYLRSFLFQALRQNSDYLLLEEFQALLKKCEENQVYHNSPKERFLILDLFLEKLAKTHLKQLS